MLPSIEDRDQTDRLTINDTDCLTQLILTLTLTFIYDLDFQSPASHEHAKQSQRSVGSKDRLETNARTDAIDYSSALLTRSVISDA